MASPQKEKGHTPVANEVLDSVLSRQFSKRQIRILNIVWRFSYGFNKKVAYIDKMKDFDMYGIPHTTVRRELIELERLSVLLINWDSGEIEFNKDYDQWLVPLNSDFDEARHRYMVRLNLNPKERSDKGWSNANRGGGRPKKQELGLQNINQTGLQNDNLNENRLMNRKPIGYENENLQVIETETYAEDQGNDTNSLQPSKASSMQVGLKNNNDQDTQNVSTKHSEPENEEAIIDIMKISDNEINGQAVPTKTTTEISTVQSHITKQPGHISGNNKLLNGMDVYEFNALIEFKVGVVKRGMDGHKEMIDYLATQPEDRLRTVVEHAIADNTASRFGLQYIYDHCDQWDYWCKKWMLEPGAREDANLKLMRTELADYREREGDWSTHIDALEKGIAEAEGR